MTKTLVKRTQRQMAGGMVYMRIYSDGSSRVRTDHPSNDPAIEVAMMAAVMALLRDAYAENGLGSPKYGALTLRDDPPR